MSGRIIGDGLRFRKPIVTATKIGRRKDKQEVDGHHNNVCDVCRVSDGSDENEVELAQLHQQKGAASVQMFQLCPRHRVVLKARTTGR